MDFIIAIFVSITQHRSQTLLRFKKNKSSPSTSRTAATTQVPSESTLCTTVTPTNSWHKLSTDSLHTLLQKANYPDAQIPHFLALWKHIVPYLTQGLHATQSEVKSKLSRDGTPYDMQWNLVESSTSASDSTIRVSFDTGGQPKEFILSLAKLKYLAPGDARTDLLDSALRTLAAIGLPEESAHAPWFASGIDMLRSSQLLYKIYLRPATAGARALSHERANAIVSAWDKTLFNGGLGEAYSVIEKYNRDLEEEQMQKVHMLGWDCVDVSKTRVKVYTYHSHTSLRTLKEMWTQRGQLIGPEIDIGLRSIEELYALFLAPENKTGDPSPEELEERESTEQLSRVGKPQSICLGLEIKPGAQGPLPKIYLQPARFGKKSDKEIAVALQGWFKTRGLGEVCETYEKDFGEIFPHRDHTLEAGCHSLLSLAVKKGGKVAVTLYLQPMIYKTFEQSTC